jgi:hypothetical protein
MPTLNGTMPYPPRPTSPCRWCGEPTDLTFAPEGTRIGPVPLHIVCGIAVIRAFERLRDGALLTEGEQRQLAAVAGHAAISG